MEMQTHKNHPKNIVPKIEINKANTHPDTDAKRPTNNPKSKQATKNG